MRSAIALLLSVMLAGCDARTPPPPAPPPALATGENVYRQTCQACHGMGVAGAPRLGDREHWAARIMQDREVLYRRAIEGFTGTTGTMPPRGGRPDLSDERVKAAVDYMLSKL